MLIPTGPVSLFWWITRKVRFSDYEAIGAEKFERERRVKRRTRISAATLLALAVVLAYRSGWRLSMLAQLAKRYSRLV